VIKYLISKLKAVHPDIMKATNLVETEGIPEGLTKAEAERLTVEGKVNNSNEKVGKSYLKILADNLFTYFNLIWAIVTALIIFTKSYSNLTFLAVVLPNIIISTAQEMRAKKTVEKLSMSTEPKATVIRDGELVTINATEIVLGDVVLIESGKQIPADAVVISGLAEANESMLTGESDAIKKEPGDKVLAGSYLVGGSIYAKVTHVGRDNYIHKIEKAAKSFTAPSSNLFNELNKLIKIIGIFLIPMSLILSVFNYIDTRSISETIVTSCASIIGAMTLIIGSLGNITVPSGNA
jgi:cation-transporting ATPase E